MIDNNGTVWNKSDGVKKITEIMKDTLDPPGRTLICGDTASDLPMVGYAAERNPEVSLDLFIF